MPDDLNALLAANRSSSVLQGIANPPLVNPLAAITAGNQAAQAEFQTRGLQAQQAIGQILQQSTDENGNVDYNKAHQMAAQAGPVVQMGMAKFAEDAATRRGQQINQAGALHSLVGSMAASLMNDPSDENLAKIRASAATQLPPGALTELDRIGALPPEQRRAEAYKHTLARMDALTQMARSPYAPPESVDTGAGGRVPVQTVAPSPYGQGGATVLGGGVSQGPPSGATVSVTTYSDDDGPLPVGPDGKFTRAPKGQVVPQTELKPATAVPGVSRGGQQLPGPPSFVMNGQPPPPVAPSGGPPAAPDTAQPPTSGPGSIVNVPGQGNRIRPRFDPQTGQPMTYSDTPPAMPPGARPDSPATHRAAPPAPAPDQRPPAVTSTPPGQVGQMDANVKAYTEDQLAYQDVITRAQNTAHAYDALKLLKDMDSTTGVGTAAVNTVRSRLAGLGLLPQGSVDILKLKDLFAKYTEKAMIDAAGPSSDLGKKMAEKSNAGDTVSMAANFDVLRNNLAKDLQKAAASKSHEDKRGYGYIQHRNDVADTDPRGFIWNTYSVPEQAQIKAEVRAQGQKAVDRLNTAIGMAHQLGVQVPGATLAPPAPDKRSFLMPPPVPRQNALAMTG